jgi:CP family cyanate transporter-like MFS transporter
MGVVFGIGMGINFALAMSLIVLRSPDTHHVAELSRMAQSVGYTVAAFGPLVAGALHDMTGGWTAPLAVILALTVPELICGLTAARPGLVAGVVSGPAERAGPGEPRRALTQDG